jgi:hypothetical protein
MKDFDFDNLATLAQINPMAFEAERSRILSAAIREIPEKNRAACQSLQAELDRTRSNMSSEKFLTHLAGRIKENLENLGDAWTMIATQCEQFTENKPILASLKKEISKDGTAS